MSSPHGPKAPVRTSIIRNDSTSTVFLSSFPDIPKTSSFLCVLFSVCPNYEKYGKQGGRSLKNLSVLKISFPRLPSFLKAGMRERYRQNSVKCAISAKDKRLLPQQKPYAGILHTTVNASFALHIQYMSFFFVCQFFFPIFCNPAMQRALRRSAAAKMKIIFNDDF